MDGFLDRLADDLIRHKEELHLYTVVLPSKRAGLFLRDKLSERTSDPIWLPKITNLQDWVLELSGLDQEDRLPLMFELYESYLEHQSTNPDDFESFHKWGGQMLGDFNNIDLYLIDPKDLFINLRSVKDLEGWELGEWSFDNQSLGRIQKNFHSFWELMPKIYKSFRDRLSASGRAYTGMAFRKFSEDVEGHEFGEQKILFAGLNALSKSEIKIIRTTIKKGAGTIYWDMDRYYCEDPEHEAGLFFRQYRQNWIKDAEVIMRDDFKSVPKKIRMVGVAGNVTQTMVAGNILADLPKPDDMKTVVVLADEGLLVPTLLHIPDSVGHTNVTMGLPLASTSVPSLINTMIDLQINYKSGTIYHKHLLRILDHPIIRSAFPSRSADFDQIKSDIIRSNKIRVEVQEVLKVLGEDLLWSLIFCRWESPASNWGNKVIQISRAISSRIGSDSTQDQFNRECLFHLIKLTDSLVRQLENKDHVQSLRLFRNLLNDVFRKDKLDFIGEPLKGLQLMGLLETRSLDFDRVILLSANEQVLPKPAHDQSLIPYDLRMYFGLPGRHEKESIFAYHFYRLLQRSKETWLLYNTQQEDFRLGEVSRYLTQLDLEFGNSSNPTVQLSKEIVHSSIDLKDFKESTLLKTDFTKSRLGKLAERGFSPSALQTYVNSPIDFYFKYVIGLYEADEIEEEVGHAGFGDVVHEVLEKLYTPIVGKSLASSDIDRMQAIFEEHLERSWEDHYPFADRTQGKHLLTYEAMKQQIRSFLQTEGDLVSDEKNSLKILGLEEELEMKVDTPWGEVKLRGKIDRIDSLNESVRVLDYKTGRTESGDVTYDPENPEKVFDDPKKGKALQLMVYHVLYTEAKGTIPARTGIISLRNPEDNLISLRPAGRGKQPIDVETMKSNVVDLIRRIMDPEEPFRSNPEAKYATIVD